MQPTKPKKRKPAADAEKLPAEKKPRAKPVSLHPLDFDEAMRRLVSKPPRPG